MKLKLLLASVALATTSALIVAPTARADDENKTSPQGATYDKTGQSSIGQSHKLTKVSQLTTASVKTSSGETLGQINDLVVDPATGRIKFAVISPTGVTGMGKLTALPWPLIQSTGEGSTLTANVDKTKFSTAQTFDRFQWPDMSQATWAQQIYSYYGLQYPDRSSAGGRIPVGDSDVGTGVSPNKDSDLDKGTAPKGNDNQNRPGTPDNPIPGKKDSGLK